MTADRGGKRDQEPAGRDRKPLTPAAARALAEAEARREERRKGIEAPRELGGRNGPDPVRYGDWEKDGILSDF